jgi:predicted alpha/beta-fold hydrolase
VKTANEVKRPLFYPQSPSSSAPEPSPRKRLRTEAKPAARQGGVRKRTLGLRRRLGALVGHGQHAQLARYAAAQPQHAALWAQRGAALTAHLQTLTPGQLLAMAGRQVVDRCSLLRSFLMRTALHPAIAMYADGTGLADAQVGSLVQRGEARRVHFFTRDHVLLDGLVLRAGQGADSPSTPMLVVGLGNAMVYEQMIELCRPLTQAPYSVNVLLYNDRGIGKSLGRQTSTQQAVLDCRAALCFAKQHSQNLGVFGISLGGGVTAAALAQAQDAGEVVAQDVGVYINCHSFPSLSKCIGSLVNPWVGAFARGLFALLGINNLDTAQVLQSRRLARDVVVLTASDDTIMRDSGRLAHALAHHTVDDLELRESPGFGHNAVAAYFDASCPLHGTHLARWAQRR